MNSTKITKFILLTVVAWVIGLHVQAQQAEWKLPQVEIPLVKGEETLAVLKPVYSSKRAVLVVGDTNYKIKLKRNGGQCVITQGDSEEVLATGKRLNTKRGVLEFSNGQTYSFSRSGKRDNREIVWNENASMQIKDEQILASITNTSINQLLAQAVLVLNHTHGLYESERSANMYYYPIIIPQ